MCVSSSVFGKSGVNRSPVLCPLEEEERVPPISPECFNNHHPSVCVLRGFWKDDAATFAMSGYQAQTRKSREESSRGRALSNQSSTMVPQEPPTLAIANLLSAPILHNAAFTQPIDDLPTMQNPNKDCGAKGPTYASTISASNNDTGVSDETAIAAVRHTDKQPPAHIETVTRKCDLNDYLINVRSSVAQSSTAKGGEYYTTFEKLVRCAEWERSVRKWTAWPMPRMRLCGGGEDSINNGTSAWGTPPSATSNGTANAWGVLPNQQQPQQPLQQQSLPPPVWGNSNNNNNGGNHTLSVGNSVAASSTMATMDDTNSNSAAKGSSQPPTPASAASGAWNNVPPANHHRNGQHHQPLHLPNANCVANNNAAAGVGGQQGGNIGANSAAPKNQQLEQLNTMREALFAQDGWGCEHVNQDTNWEVPGSPEPQSGGASGSNPANAVPKPPDGRLGPNGGGGSGGGSAGGGAPNGAWKVTNMNTGTELWETNLRNGGQVPQHHSHQQQPKVASAPWVPTNNLGGTWMEDDDTLSGSGAGPGAVAVAEAVGSVWNGSAAAIVAGTAGPHVGGPPGTGSWGGGVSNGGGSNAGWPPGGGNGPLSGATSIMPQTMAGVKKDLSDWSAVSGAVGIGGSGGLVVSGSAAGWTNDGRSVVAPSTGGFNMAAAGAPAGIAQSAGPSATTLVDSAGLNRGGGGELRGDPRGISGRLSGAMVGGAWAAGAELVASLLDGANKIPSMSGPTGISGSAGQPWGGGTATNGGAIVSQSKIPSGWGDEPGGRPSSLSDDQTIGTAAGTGMLWGQSNPTTAGGAGIPARQNSAGGWKDLANDGVMMGRGGPMGRGQQPGNGGGGPLVATLRFDRGSAGAAILLRNAAAGPSMWDQRAQLAEIGTWENPSPVWGDGEKGGSAPWNADLGPGGNAGGGWNKTPTTPKSGGSAGWPDPGSDLSTAGTMDWCLGGKSAVTPGLNKSPSTPLEYIRASKEFRVLCEMGHKKEEVEFALRTTNMNIEEAMELLRHGVAAGGWRRPLLDDHHATSIGGGMPFDGPFSGPRIPPLNHAAGGLAYSQNNQVMLNNIAGGPGGLGGMEGAGGPANLVALNNFKYLSQGSAGTITGAHPSFNHNSLLPPGGGGGRSQQPQAAALQQQHHQQQLAAAAAAQPSNQQLRLLVQHIQLAVQNGFLNHQILNQPLAPQTLILLNQLLNHIKQMQLTQSNLARSSATSGVSAVQLTLTINKHKSQIAQLQQQIAAQQSIYLKQQQQPGHQGAMPPPSLLSSGSGAPAMDFLRHQQDLMALQSNFGELALGKDALLTSSNTVGGVFPPVPVSLAPHASVAAAPIGGGSTAAAAAGGNGSNSSSSTSQQSRLNQWKLPSLEKEPTAGKDDLTDFSRAPGPTAKSTSTTSTTLSSLGLVQDGTWTAGHTNLADGWPEQTGETDSKDWTTTNTSSQDNSTFTDLVPEFEPGKPWKGTQMKIEDDPSITPGSVARSPLSIATAKDSELFAVSDKVSPSSSSVAVADGGGLNLTSSAWSFNAAGSSSPVSTGKVSVTGASKSVWPDSTGTGGGDVWCTPIGKTATRGPPPGLGGTSTAGTGTNWDSTGAAAGGWGTGTSWLLLRNLTSQIDASTLRTLCMQHGPILSFHPYPAHGLALCRYTTRDEATKAQQALNNCPLGASTISAECPSNDAEVQTYLQQLGVSATATNVAVSNASSGAGSISNLSSQSWRQGSSASATGGTDTWGSGWPIGAGGAGSANGSANLWAPLDAADKGTPSSLNSFLPESLLGPELN
ncbi:protein Gawky-like [Anopheles bellator]|uniref:protein Gawky-like n=1 Tax=Anopheles bellator TaxID=139047 RepID=UPI002649DF4B|nr:protein Gawky-like [Anopheles bellator]